MKFREDVSKFIDEQVREGHFPNAEAVIDEAVSQYMIQPDFAPGELDRLIAEGEASDPLDGEAVLAEFKKLRERPKSR